jgi:hypothetical protein
VLCAFRSRRKVKSAGEKRDIGAFCDLGIPSFHIGTFNPAIGSFN